MNKNKYVQRGFLFIMRVTLIIFLSSFSILMAKADQRAPISGKVTDENGEGLPGANVLVKGTTGGSLTDEKGEFQIEAAPDAILLISSIGYKPFEIAVGNQTVITAKMEIDVTQLSEVVVVGYGTQKKATLTGSVAQVDGAEIMKSPAPNITSSLQGRLPGLTAVQRSGQPGRDDAALLIRGAQTLGDSGPLIVIDGVQGRGNIARLNPEDIETITILKDASAAIYGARGANGVLIVTTKNGKKGAPTFNFTYKQGLSSPTMIPDVLDAPTFAQVYNEGAYYRGGRNPNYWNNPQYSTLAIQKFADGSDPVLYPNTDWVGEMLKPSSSQKNTNLSVTGGSDNVRYLLSFGTLEQNGSFRADPTLYRQFNTRVKIDVDLVKNLTVGINTSAIFNRRNYAPGGGVPFVDILGANPILVARYPNGLLGPGRLGQNPLTMDQRGYNREDQTPLYTTFTASFKVPYVDGLKLDGSFNYDLSNTHQKVWSKPYNFYEYNTITGNYDNKFGTNPVAASLDDTYRKSTNMLYNLRASYDQIFGEHHHVFAMIGIEQQKIENANATATRRNFISPSIDEINVGGTDPADYGSSGSSSQDAYDNLLGRFNYDFKSKYIVEFLFRRDGSPRFPAEARYGFFPGVSGAWRISEEDFFKNSVPFVSQLKVKASYGELGNDRISEFQYFQSFGFGNNYVFGSTVAPGLTTQSLPNPNVTWERAKKTDLGLEATLWDGKLGVDLTLWKQKRSDILVARNLGIPNTMGFPGLPPENYGEVDSRGYELALSHRNKAGQLTYSVSGNVAYAVSKVIQMDEVPPAYDYQKATGMPLNTSLYYKADGIFNTAEERNANPRQNNQQVGDIKTVDLNEDGVINNSDQYRNRYTSTPRYVFGVNTDFQYKNFDLTVFFQGQTGVRNYDGQAASLGNTDFTNAAVWRAEDRWTEQNPEGTKPRSDAFQPGNTDFFLFDATFIRLKTVELGYSIPTSILGKTKFLKGLRVFASGFNVATWAKEIKWADPELNGGYFTWPPQRVITFGGSIKF